MSKQPPQHLTGRTGVIALIVLALAALALYLYSERAVPPTSPEVIAPSQESPIGDDSSVDRGSPSSVQERSPSDIEDSSAVRERSGRFDTEDPTDASGEIGAGRPSQASGVEPAVEPIPPVSIEQAGARLRVELAERLLPEQLDRVVSNRLVERLVTTVHSLDGVPVPLRFRPLAHVPDLPRIVGEGDNLRLPAEADPRYARYRALFDRLDAGTLASLFERHEPAFDAAWQALGETDQGSFRARLIEVLDHLSAFEVPETRPRLIRPEVLYEFADPVLEQQSWGRKILIRVGQSHAAAIQRKARELATLLERPGRVDATRASGDPTSDSGR